jgi:hypothetical protein
MSEGKGAGILLGVLMVDIHGTEMDWNYTS